MQRGNEVLKLDPSLELKHGDLIVLSARRMVFAKLEHDLGPEIDDPILLSVPVKSVAIGVNTLNSIRTDHALVKNPLEGPAQGERRVICVEIAWICGTHERLLAILVVIPSGIPRQVMSEING